MIKFLSDEETEEKPPEPDGDGDPGRSSAPHAAFTKDTHLVADDTEEFEEPRTGVSITCDPTEQEIYRCLKTARNSSASFRMNFIAACILFISVGISIANGVQNGDGVQFILAACWFVLAMVFLFWPLRKIRAQSKEAAGGGEIRMVVYPDRIEMQTGAGPLEIPLDRTSELFRTKETFALLPPAAKEQKPRLLVLPFRCIDGDVLPYVEATLLAGTKPFIGRR